jgi:hypothetical protein
MVKPVGYPTDSQRAYQQALDDFGITELLTCLKNFSDANFDAAWMNLSDQEVESLATILIQGLTANIKGRLIANYLDIMRRGSKRELTGSINLEFPPPSVDLPANFPNEAEPPRFLYGDKLRWIPMNGGADWGTVIGRFYGFASHHCSWKWCYLIWLDKESPSSAWVIADTAWEEDLEPMVEEKES